MIKFKLIKNKKKVIYLFIIRLKFMKKINGNFGIGFQEKNHLENRLFAVRKIACNLLKK